jgi:O-antigen/teichoic acid export membrane protein
VDYSSRLLRSSAARVGTTFASIAVALFLTPFVVRTLGDYWYGLWVIVNGITIYYYLFDLGLSSAVNRFVTARVARKDSEGVNEVASTAVALFALLGLGVIVAASGVFLAVPWFVRPDYVRPVRLVVLLQGLNLGSGFPFKTFGGVAAAQLRYDLIEALNLAQTLCNAVLVVLVLSHGGGIVALACVSLVLGQAYNVAFYLVAKHLWPPLALSARHVKRSVARELSGYSIWSFVNQISDMLRFRIDSLVVAGFCGVSVVTHYGIGASPTEYGSNLVRRATSILTPLFVRYQAEGDDGAIRSKLVLFNKVNAVLSFFGFGLMFVLGRLFILRWMGPRFADSYPVLLVMGAALMLDVVMQPANNVLYALARHPPYVVAVVCEALANVALSILLARRYGMVGVAIGTLIPLAVNSLLFTPVYTCRVVDLALWRFYAPIARTALVTGGFLLLVLAAVVYFRVPAAYPGIFFVLCVAVPLYLPVAFFGILTSGERIVARGLVLRLFSGRAVS